MAVGEVRPVRSEQLRPRPDVVVDDVEDHRQPGRVRRVDEAREPERTAVGPVRRGGEHAVVAPAALAGEGRDRHQLDRRDAQLGELGQARRRRVEGALGREGADVELVDDEIFQRDRDRLGAPLERARSSTRDGPRRPPGCQREQGSAKRPPPSSAKPVVVARRRRQPRREDAARPRGEGRARDAATVPVWRPHASRSAPRRGTRRARPRPGRRRAGPSPLASAPPRPSRSARSTARAR